LDGYSNPEIAGIIGISSNNVGVKLHRIKAQLALIITTLDGK
jgi:DNA-directed RNA polymerase specialized sigma24 family protein